MFSPITFTVSAAAVEGVRPRPAETHDRKISGWTENHHERQERQEVCRIIPQVSSNFKFPFRHETHHSRRVTTTDETIKTDKT